MSLVPSPVEDAVKVVKVSAAEKFINFSFFGWVEGIIPFWLFWRFQRLRRLRVWVFKQSRVSSSEEQRRNNSVLPVNNACNLVCLGGYENVAGSEI